MIAFLPTVRLRELGKQVELRKFNEAAQGLSSIETLMAGVLFRFAVDAKCPAIFIMTPKEGDEPIEGLVFTADFDQERFMGVAHSMFAAALDNFGTDDISFYRLSNRVYLLSKNDFKEGAWENYGYELSGTDGISIPA